MPDDSADPILAELDRLRASLRQTESGPWLTLALQAARMIGYRTDLRAGEVTASDDAARFHGAPAGEVVRTPEQALLLVHPDDRPALYTALEAARAGEPLRAEFRGAWPAPDGGDAWFETRARLVRQGEDDPGVLFGVTFDVTARKRDELRRGPLEEQRRQTEQLESLGVLAGGIAHEFNNLLTTIQGYADLARAELHAGPAQGYLNEVLTATRRAAELTQQIVNYAGKGRFNLQPLSPDELLRQASPLLAAAVSRKARLVLDVGADVPAVLGDAGQLQQVVLSLVTNASEALGGGEGTVTVRLGEATAGEPPARFARLEVSDTGCGMDEPTRARVFEPFFSTKFTGRGLGLAAVLGIVRRHGGSVHVQSEPGKGSTFQVLLPAADALPSTPTPPAGPGLLLIVDDEAGVRDLAALVLRQAGHEVVTAPDGASALQRFRQAPDAYRAALIDLTMPRMHGLELLAALRERRPDLPVVLMTGYSAAQAAGRAAASGTLQKPFTAAALVEVIRQALGEAADA